MHRAAVLGVLAAAGTALPASATTTNGPSSAPRRRLEFQGVAYDTGTGFIGDESRVLWERDLVRGELRAIRDRLHANWVSIYGSDVERLTDTATDALRLGLKVSIQPRSFDEPQEDALAKLARTAREAERLRCRYGPEVILVIGCEFMLFTPGIVPGANFFERVEYLTTGNPDMAELQRKLRAFTARAVAVARSNFHGRITYGAASDLEQIDWSLFDLVGLDYYSYHEDRAGHTAELARFRRWGKPILILEFGCCTFTGAPEAGGMGWDIVDYTVDPPEIKDGFVRDEQAQADHLRTMLTVFREEGFLGASPYTFISPDAPHRLRDPKHDEDIAGYGLCKVIRKDSWDPASPYRWEPKKSFHAVAETYRTR
ncbi:hypothetical protein FB561_1041 [Kribbella amoyensis]|uniref:Abortive infection protein n=2 Tax=Kribbella amoyensis TaxID=996641 RepID=A0A561BM87_9ACTN|nr:hypothetical protein FB561_1041 [Kribbella amoyensis]